MRASAGSLLLGIFAVLFGLLGAYVVRKELYKPKVVAPVVKDDKPVTITVPVASLPLEPGRKIEFGDIAILNLTPAQMKARNIRGNFMPNTKQIIGRVLKRELKEGSVFDTPDFYPEGTGPAVAERLKKGYRAVTVSVNQDSAVAGFAIPGSIVDVLFRANSEIDRYDGRQSDELPETTVTLIEAAEVLALNQDTTQVHHLADPKLPPRMNDASVTLAVTPRQAASLRVVEGRGTMSLALRNKDDLDVTDEVSPRTLDDLLKRSNPKHVIETYRGRQVSQSSFRDKRRSAPTDNNRTPDIKVAPAPAPLPKPIEN